MKEIRGMTWSHSRGYSSICAVSQRYEELHPDVQIQWDKRSLAKFENQPVGDLAKSYDILIIDHPWTGFAAASGVLLQLENLFPRRFLIEQSKSSIGASYESYTVNGHQMALPVDGATPIAIYRPDLLSKEDVPHTWDELIQLARGGKVVFAAAPLYTLLDFFMMCSSIADDQNVLYGESIGPKEILEEALEKQRELAALCPKVIFEKNPIEIHEMMSGDSEDYVYCPFIFGYSNYSRAGYSRHILKAADVVDYKNRILRTTLGGTGLALSSRCHHIDVVVDFCEYVLSEEIQKTIYFEAGGQPSNRAAWTDENVNLQSNGFFKDTIRTIENASMRPRYNGYMELQDHGGAIVREYLMTGSDLSGTIEKLNRLYQKSRRLEK